MKKNIISIQSKLIYGYVGNNIAELAIQLHGIDVVSLPTVILSAHTGHKPIHGQAISKELFDDLVTGIEEIGIINNSACIISGYIGTEDIILSTSDFIKRIKSVHPEKLYICDPVMGDVGQGLYIPEQVAQNILTSLIPICDILTPNHFELEYILNCKINTLSNLLDGVKNNPTISNKTLIVTSCNLDDTPSNQIETIIVNSNKVKRICAPKVDIDTTGTGDFFTSLLSAQLTMGKDVVLATTHASSTISKVLDYIVKEGLEEMNAESLIKYVRA